MYTLVTVHIRSTYKHIDINVAPNFINERLPIYASHVRDNEDRTKTKEKTNKLD